MRQNLTDRFLNSISAPRNGKPRETFWDAKTPGFGLRVTANGVRSWVILYRHHGRSRWMTLGTYPTMPLADARRDARAALVAAQKGGDPAAEKQTNRGADTWAGLCDQYLTEDARKNRKAKTVYEYELIIDNALPAAWRNRKAKDVSRADVNALAAAIRGRGTKVYANRVLAMISIIANFGVQQGVLDFNPASRIKKSKEPSRERVLADDEIRKVWKAFDEVSQGAAFKLGLLTGQRPGEVSGMTWDEINLEAGVWTIPAERAKNGLSHRVPLVGQTLTILRGLQQQGDHPFPQGLRLSFDRVRELSGVAFTAHDLRRTCGTGLAQLGVDRTTIKKVLNHSERGDVTAIYDRHGYDAEKRDALARWDERIASILAGPTESITPAAIAGSEYAERSEAIL